MRKILYLLSPHNSPCSRQIATKILRYLEAYIKPDVLQLDVGPYALKSIEHEIGEDGVLEIRNELNRGIRELIEKMKGQNLLLDPEPSLELPCWDPNYVPDPGA